MDWLEEFNDLFLKGKREEAYKLKYGNFPKKLYKYEIIHEGSLDNLKNNELWFAKPESFNDPFDSCGICFDENNVSPFIEGLRTNKKAAEQFIYDYIEKLKSNIKACCFSEELNSMPMWAHYADNHKGICIEYDFSKLNYMNKLSKYLFPVRYEREKYDITKFLEHIFKEDEEERLYFLFFLMQIKHVSWSYEKEWRIIFKNDTKENMAVACPIKPEGIYLGVNCTKENVEKIKTIVNENINCPIYELEKTNGKLFEFKTKNIT